MWKKYEKETKNKAISEYEQYTQVQNTEFEHRETVILSGKSAPFKR